MEKAAFNNKILFISKLDINLKKNPVKCNSWSTALYGTETWTLRKVGQKYLVSFKCGIGERRRRSVEFIV
jgi:hypothetical protein